MFSFDLSKQKVWIYSFLLLGQSLLRYGLFLCSTDFVLHS